MNTQGRVLAIHDDSSIAFLGHPPISPPSLNHTFTMYKNTDREYQVNVLERGFHASLTNFGLVD
jgi:hypothetical protein